MEAAKPSVQDHLNEEFELPYAEPLILKSWTPE